MKIIAEMGSSRKMAEVTDSELALILGFDSVYDSALDKRLMEVGKDIDVAKFYRVSKSVRNLNTSYMRQILNRMADAEKEVTAAVALADELQVFEKLKGNE